MPIVFKIKDVVVLRKTIMLNRYIFIFLTIRITIINKTKFRTLEQNIIKSINDK